MKRYRAVKTGEKVPLLGRPDQIVELTMLVPDPWYSRWWRRLKRLVGLRKDKRVRRDL